MSKITDVLNLGLQTAAEFSRDLGILASDLAHSVFFPHQGSGLSSHYARNEIQKLIDELRDKRVTLEEDLMVKRYKAISNGPGNWGKAEFDQSWIEPPDMKDWGKTGEG